jgi:class 3 adenylate cyclase
VLPDHLHPVLSSAVDTWATVFVAIGTVGAVAYALFRGLFVVPRRRPRLDVRFDRTGNDQVVVGTAGRFDAAHVRLRVANGAGKETADDVVVMVTEVRQLEDSRLRIGISSGPVVAGVIGRRRFLYDLWGDTVNMASRMESHGAPDEIQITRSTWELLDDHFMTEPIGLVDVKGKGEIETWRLVGPRGHVSASAL